MPTPTSKVEFVRGQFYFGETEIEIGGMEIRVQYHFLPMNPDEFPYNDMEAEEVHFKGVHMKHVRMGQHLSPVITWLDVKDLLEETSGGDLGDLLQNKLNDLCVVYAPNDRPVEE